MARYYFHSQTDTRFTDSEGIEFVAPSEARQEAIRLCGEMLKEAPDPFWGSRPWSLSVTDGTGLILWEIFIDGVSSAAAPD